MRSLLETKYQNRKNNQIPGMKRKLLLLKRQDEKNWIIKPLEHETHREEPTPCEILFWKVTNTMKNTISNSHHIHTLVAQKKNIFLCVIQIEHRERLPSMPLYSCTVYTVCIVPRRRYKYKKS